MPKEIPTKNQPKKGRRSRQERESRLQRFILLAGTLIIVSVIALVSTGYYFTQYRPLHEPAIAVNGTQFDMEYYVSAFKYYGTSQDVTELIEQSELIRQAASKLGIEVTDDEARAEVETRKLPVNNVYTTFIKYELLVKKLTDEYFDEKIPNSAPQREMMAMLIEDSQQATDMRNRIVNGGEDFSKLAAQYSVDNTTKAAAGYGDWHPKDAISSVFNSAVLSDYVFNATVGVVSEPLKDPDKIKSTGYWIMKLVERQEDKVHIMVILCPDESTAIAARKRIENGEDFATVARAVSQMPGVSTDGGDIGFISKGERGDLFDAFAFNAKNVDGTLGEIVHDTVITTKGGYWLVKVLAEDPDKTLSKTDRDNLKARTYYEWVQSLWSNKDNKIETFITPEQMNWAKEQSKKG